SGFWPRQSTLISRLTPPTRRHAAFAQQRLTMNLGIGLGGIVGGLIARVSTPSTFTTLFVLDALTFLVYVGVLWFVHDPGMQADEAEAPASYRSVLRHKTFLGLWAINFLFLAAGYSLFSLFPQFGRDGSGISERQIGVLFAVNTAAIVLAQLPISHWIEGRRRMRALALMPLLWAVSWLIVDGAGAWLEATAAFLVFASAMALFGIGECVYRPAHHGLVAAISPLHLRGTVFAVPALSPGTCAEGTCGSTRSRGATRARWGPPSAGSSSPPPRSCSGRSPRPCASSPRAARSPWSGTSRRACAGSRTRRRRFRRCPSPRRF